MAATAHGAVRRSHFLRLRDRGRPLDTKFGNELKLISG
jgi:hypothetical protein